MHSACVEPIHASSNFSTSPSCRESSEVSSGQNKESCLLASLVLSNKLIVTVTGQSAQIQENQLQCSVFCWANQLLHGSLKSKLQWQDLQLKLIKYRSLATTICEVICVKELLKELGLKHLGSAPIFYDNQAALTIAANPINHEKTKHIGLIATELYQRKSE